MGFGGLSIATSGIRAAQRNLNVTAHNVANSEIPGFSRQRIVQTTSFSRTVGISHTGIRHIVGMGADWGAVQQIRNEFLDISYRENVGRLQFYSKTVEAGLVIESLLGELHGAYNFQSILNDMWYALQELTAHPDGIETRQMLLATSAAFLTKAQSVHRSLFEYQQNLDMQIRDMVSEINQTVARINQLNTMIRANESDGSNANDFRDERHRLVDRLAEMIPINVFHCNLGDVNITSKGHEILVRGSQNFMGLRYITNEFNFVEPVFTQSSTILSAGTPPDEFVAFMNYSRGISNQLGNDFGGIMALMLARGNSPGFASQTEVPRPTTPTPPDPTDLVSFPLGAADPAFIEAMAEFNLDMREYEADVHNWRALMWSAEHALIPEVQMNLDRIVGSVVRMLNDAVTGNLVDADGNYLFTHPNGDPMRPTDLNGRIGIPIFIRIDDRDVPTWPLDPAPDHGNVVSLLTINNLRINPELLGPGGHNNLALSLSGAEGDTDLLEALQIIWKSTNSNYSVRIGNRSLNVQDAYIRMTNDISTHIHEANTFVTNQTIQTLQADQLRNAIKGVSMDEEMSDMLRFQFAFQAASRVFNVIDGMIDQVINRTGRVGL